jgi:hypothetical protein
MVRYTIWVNVLLMAWRLRENNYLIAKICLRLIRVQVGNHAGQVARNGLWSDSWRTGVSRDAGLRPHCGRFENRAVQNPHNFLAEFLVLRPFPYACPGSTPLPCPQFLEKMLSLNTSSKQIE